MNALIVAVSLCLVTSGAFAQDQVVAESDALGLTQAQTDVAVAEAAPGATAGQVPDPNTYKPRTEHDNTPYRFNMHQEGRQMTADEFDAWMKARGVRVARGSGQPAAAAAAVAATDATATAETPATAALPAGAAVDATEAASGE